MAAQASDARAADRKAWRFWFIVLTFLSLPVPSAQVQAEVPPSAARDLADLSPDQLAQIEITSVSKKPETRWRSPAAIHVITRDDIRRSGVTTLVDALRLAPGVQVARIDSNKWAVGVRGFASTLTRSLLVMIDGRSVYTPLFAGTYWDMQDLLLEDVERIEIIRGPGGSLWGANAVNGIVNIITRSSRETRGAYATLAAGTPDRFQAGVRYGGAVRERLTYRVYAKGFDRGPGFHPAGSPGDEFDEWQMGQAGFRADWDRGPSDALEVNGDIYRGEAGSRASVTRLDPPSVEVVEGDTRLRGGHVLARWRQLSAGGAEWGLRTYYDRTDRREVTFGEGRDTFDLEVQRRAAYGRHELVVGGGYRLSSGTVESVPTIAFTPARRADQLWSGFFRDEVSLLGGRLVLAVGSKLEHNDYTGFEVQPTLQALWAPTDRQVLWAAASRSVRTPSRVEHDLSLTALVDPRTPIFARVIADGGFESEKVLAVEAGHRARIGRRLTLYSVVFHNTHQDLLSVEGRPPVRETEPPPERVVLPFVFGNGIRGASYGLEVAADVSPRDWWRLGASYSFLRLALRSAADSLDTTTAASTNRGSPRHSAVVESRMDIGRRVHLDAILRFVDELPGPAVPAYTTLDARLAWRPHAAVELAVVGQSLLEPHHLEFPGSAGARVEVRRGVYGSVTWRP